MPKVFLKHDLFGVLVPYKSIHVSTKTFEVDPLAKSFKKERHCHGEFSMASVQSNKDMEDHNQVDVSPDALFVGIYDGFKGPTAAFYIRTHIFRTLLKRIEQNDNSMSLKILREVVEDMEKRFILFAERSFEQEYHTAEIGLVSSGCLVCLIWRGIIYLANIGNSRAVLGSTEANGISSKLCVTQLVRDHSCENPDIRDELHAVHPGDNTICVFTEVHPVLNYHATKDPSWTVKGLIETSRCIGYAYLKKKLFTMATSFVIPVQEQVIFERPLLTAEPDVYSKVLKDTDKFIIFGSSGFWNLITNAYAAEIVNSSPRDDIAKILAVIAIEKGAKKKKTKYRNIVEFSKGQHVDGCWGVQPQRSRPVYHNDITVIVIFFDNEPSSVKPEISCYTCSDFPDTPSEFRHFYK